MGFSKKSVFSKKGYLKKESKNSHRYKGYKHKRTSGFVMKVLLGIFLLATLAFAISVFIVYEKYLSDLPDVKNLENIDIAQSSIIYDRQGNELYKIFKENRTYKEYDHINKNMINAIVAAEDKRFFENPGVDIIGLTRAVIYRILGRSTKLEGTSTLTQQLIRNTLITNEVTAERKIKEIYLAYKLTKELSKEKILELYLNKISYGSNSDGIEQASKTFFAKTAKELGILESSILASLPKGPSFYSPYNNYERLMGYIYFYNDQDSENITKIMTPRDIDENSESYAAIAEVISELKAESVSDTKLLVCGLKAEMFKEKISPDEDGCSIIDYGQLLLLLNSIKVELGEGTFTEYQTGRKDFVLGRMLEDGYINFDQYKEALLSSFGFVFEEYRENIKHPHFVFYVREYLEQKYGKDLLEQGGLRIYTTLDPLLQKKAEELVTKYAKSNEKKYSAQNAAIVSIDNATGEILTMVGGKDYFDRENKGNVNMVTAQIQPGSTFKPFVYSVAIDKEVIGSKTPIYDVETTFPGEYTPANFDGEFMGKMDISSALNHSRNIPAVKMYYIAGGEAQILKWMSALGIHSMSDFKSDFYEKYGREYAYGASMGLGSVPMSALDLASSYSTYARLGIKKDITPITKIIDSNGLVIEEHIENDKKPEPVIDPSTAYITNHILSDTSARPEFWNTYLALDGQQVAAKTGTSTKQFEKNGEKIIYPRNLWTAGYSPYITTVAWAGNNDGTPTNLKGNGLEAAGPIWKDFMKFYHDEKKPKSWDIPDGVKQIPVSPLTGMKSANSLATDEGAYISYFVHEPSTQDESFKKVQVDLLCNGRITDETPFEAIGNVDLIMLRSLRPEFPYWENPVQEWLAAGNLHKLTGNLTLPKNYITYVNKNACTRSYSSNTIALETSLKNNDVMLAGSNFVKIAYTSSKGVTQMEIRLSGSTLKNIPLNGNKRGVYEGYIYIDPNIRGQKNLEVVVRDDQYFSNVKKYNVYVGKKDKTPPVIKIDSPRFPLTLSQKSNFTLSGNIQEEGALRSTNVYLNGKAIKIGIKERSFDLPIVTESLNEGKHILEVESIDGAFNTSNEALSFIIE